MRVTVALGAQLCLGMLAAPAVLAAQRAPGPKSPRPISAELRLDAISARNTTVQLGAALLHPIGPSLRLGAVVGVGSTHGPLAEDGTERSVRAEGLARFVIDASATSSWRFYGQAGLGVLWVRGATGQPLASAVVGAQHAPLGPIRPALELGVGGGLRIAIAAAF